MAYKFQIGRARLSGSIIAEEGVKSDDLSNISSSLDLLADQNVEAGGYVEAGTNVFANSNVQAAANVVAGGEFQGNLEFSASNGSGIQSFTFDNSGNATIALDDSYATGLFSAVDTNSIDMGYDGSGAFSGSVRLKSETGGTISVDTDGLYIADSAISNAKLVNDTISGHALGTSLDSLSAATAGALDMTSYDGSAAVSDLAVRVDGTSIQIDGSNDLALVDSYARGLIGVRDTNTIDMGYDSSSGDISGSVKLKSESGGTISSDGNGLYIADGAIANAKLVNDTISGKALGTNLSDMSVTAGSALSMTAYNGSAAVSDLAVQVDGNSITISSNALQARPAWVYGLLSVSDTDSIDMTHNGSGVFSADLSLSGGVSNDALEIVAGEGLDLKSTIAGNRTFSDDVLIQGDLQVDGALTYINTTNLEVTDRLIRLAKGDSSYVDGAGFEFDWGDSFETAQVAFDTNAENAFDSSLPIQAPHMKAATFHGELVGTMKMDVVTKVDADTDLDAGKVNKYEDLTAGDTDSIALPSSATEGQIVYLKMGDVPDGSYLEVTASDIDGVTSIFLESPNAAVTFICNGSDNWMVF